MQCSSVHLVLSVLTLVISTSTCVDATTPPFLVSCRDPSNECLKETLQASLPGFIRGVPEIGVEVLDPFQVDNLNLTLPGGLIISFNEGIATGFRHCIIDKARMIKDILEVQFHCDLTIKGKYRSSGRLLMFPINGDGNSTIRCKNIRITVFVKLGSKGSENSQKYLEIKNLKAEHRFEGQVSYHMTNLFKGSPEISSLVLEFMNRNWKLVAEEFGKPIVDYGVTSIMKNIKQMLKMVPLKDLVTVPVDF